MFLSLCCYYCFISDCRSIYLFSSLAARVFNKLTRYPQHISTGFAFCLRYCSDVAHRRPTKLCTMFGRLLDCCTIYTFSGALAPDRILPGAIFTVYVQVLRSPVLAAVPPVLYGSPAAGVSQTLCKLEMWANAQRDSRPAEYTWRPLFNAAKFG